jgi:hypothetical protein
MSPWHAFLLLLAICSQHQASEQSSGEKPAEDPVKKGKGGKLIKSIDETLKLLCNGEIEDGKTRVDQHVKSVKKLLAGSPPSDVKGSKGEFVGLSRSTLDPNSFLPYHGRQSTIPAWRLQSRAFSTPKETLTFYSKVT